MMRKILFYNVKMLMAVVVATVISVMAGCKKDVYEPGKENNGPVFDFSTKSSYTLNVKYDVPEGYKVYFEVYGENPTEPDATGKYVKKKGIEPLDKGFTDSKGVYSKPLSVPAYVQKVFIYSPYSGVPNLLTAEIKNDALVDAVVEYQGNNITSAEKSLFSRAADRYVEEVSNSINGLNVSTLGRWIHNSYGTTYNFTDFPNLNIKSAMIWGRPETLQSVDKLHFPGSTAENKLDVTADILKTINGALPGDNDGKTIDPELLKSGIINVKKEATLDLYILLQECQYMNTLAYYCYKTSDGPSSAKDYHVVALPHASIIGRHGGYINGVNDYGALFAGEGIRLRYFENGVDKGATFPAGVSIGWVLYADSYKSGGVHVIGKDKVLYSDPTLMSNISQMAVFRSGNFVMMGCEDTKKDQQDQKCDYRDLVFHVKSNPADAITGEIPNVDPEEPADVAINHYGMLFYEDIWPFRGDFDMNDVVVKYKSELQMNPSNEIVKSTDTYTVMWSGASFNNSFAIHNENLSKAGDIVITRDGVVVSDVVIDRTNNIVRLANGVLDYANKKEKVVFTITATFGSPIAKEQFVLPPYNPFIAVKGEVKNEVHLTNFVPTSYADIKLLGSGHDISDPAKGWYYITYNEEELQMPFAIDLSFESEEALSAFQIPMVENKRIDTYFPDFLKWITSQGKEANDWYLRPKK